MRYLKIENPGVAAEESFTLLGASTKRGSNLIGKFGTGNKQGVGVLLRNGIQPVVFAGNLRMDFSTRKHNVQGHNFDLVVVRYSGRDNSGKTRNNTQDLGYVLQHGSEDWGDSRLALREFVSNSLDAAVTDGLNHYLIRRFGEETLRKVADRQEPELSMVGEAINSYKNNDDFDKVVIEVVEENQVRAKSGTTRVFVPYVDNVVDFHDNLGKWFLHFSNPGLLDKTILPKAGRSAKGYASIYRRGVFVREVSGYYATESLFDYNLENLKLDESRQVDDYYVKYEAARALAKSSKSDLSTFWRSFTMFGKKYWEHGFSNFHDAINDETKKNWVESFEESLGLTAVLSIDGHFSDVLQRKGFNPIKVDSSVIEMANEFGVKTWLNTLSDSESSGIEYFEANAAAVSSVDHAWGIAAKYGMTNGKEKPSVQMFTKLMNAGSSLRGFYKGDVVYLNRDICVDSHDLAVTAMEEVAHHITGATDNSRDFQEFLLQLVVYSNNVGRS